MSDVQRPHCQRPAACFAQTPTKHCVACTAAIPEIKEKRVASIRRAFDDPAVRARKAAAARRVASDPTITARKTAAMTAAHQRPEVKARHRRGCQKSAIARLQDPAAAETMRRNGHAYGKANLALGNKPEAIAKRGASIRAAHLAWCPEEFWALNQQLKRQKIRLPERKEIIAQKVAEREFAGADHELAADFLRRLSAVFRCRADGQRDSVGTHWRYGTRVLDRVAIVRAAVAKGWRP